MTTAESQRRRGGGERSEEVVARERRRMVPPIGGIPTFQRNEEKRPAYGGRKERGGKGVIKELFKARKVEVQDWIQCCEGRKGEETPKLNGSRTRSLCSDYA